MTNIEILIIVVIAIQVAGFALLVGILSIATNALKESINELINDSKENGNILVKIIKLVSFKKKQINKSKNEKNG